MIDWLYRTQSATCKTFSHPDYNRRLWILTRSTLGCDKLCSVGLTGLAHEPFKCPTAGGELHPAPKISNVDGIASVGELQWFGSLKRRYCSFFHEKTIFPAVRVPCVDQRANGRVVTEWRPDIFKAGNMIVELLHLSLCMALGLLVGSLLTRGCNSGQG